MSYPGGKGGLQEDQGPTDDEIRRAGRVPWSDSVKLRNTRNRDDETGLPIRSAYDERKMLAQTGQAKPSTEVFETDEQRNLYKLAVNSSGYVFVAEEALGMLTEAKRYLSPAQQERLAELKKRLDKLCDFES